MENKAKSEAQKEDERSLSDKMADLDVQLDWFYSDDFKLEQAPERYKKAVELAKKVEKELSELQNEINVLTEDFTKKQVSDDWGGSDADGGDFSF